MRDGLSGVVSEEPVYFLDNGGPFQHSHDPPGDSFACFFGVLRGSVLGVACGFVGEIVGQSGFEVGGFGTGVSVLCGFSALLFEGHAPSAPRAAVSSSRLLVAKGSSPFKVVADRGPEIMRSTPRGVPAVR